MAGGVQNIIGNIVKYNVIGQQEMQAMAGGEGMTEGQHLWMYGEGVFRLIPRTTH